MSGQTQAETALQSLAEKLRTDAIAIFGEGQSERDIIEWFYGSLLAAAPAHPAERQEQGEVQRLQIALRLSANRLDRLALEFPDASDMKWTASEWAVEARTALAASTEGGE